MKKRCLQTGSELCSSYVTQVASYYAKDLITAVSTKEIYQNRFGDQNLYGIGRRFTTSAWAVNWTIIVVIVARAIAVLNLFVIQRSSFRTIVEATRTKKAWCPFDGSSHRSRYARNLDGSTRVLRLPSSFAATQVIEIIKWKSGFLIPSRSWQTEIRAAQQNPLIAITDHIVFVHISPG